MNMDKLKMFLFMSHQTHPNLFRLKSSQYWSNQSLNMPTFITYNKLFTHLTQGYYYPRSNLTLKEMHYNKQITLQFQYTKLKMVNWNNWNWVNLITAKSWIKLFAAVKQFDDHYWYTLQYFLRSKSWHNYKNSPMLNILNKKNKFFSKNITPLNGFLNFYYVHHQKLAHNYNTKLTLYNFQQYLNTCYSYNKCYMHTNLIMLLLAKINNSKRFFMHAMIYKWHLNYYPMNQFSVNQTGHKLNMNINTLRKHNQYKMMLSYVKTYLLKKIKLLITHDFWNTSYLNFSNHIMLSVMYQIKFLWRSKLTVNLLLIFCYLITNNKLNQNSSVLLDYLAMQFRVIFSKYEQKLLLYLLLNMNKMLLKLINMCKYTWYNNIILLQIIMTGRWQRKRWVTPFPKLYVSSYLTYNKLVKSYQTKNYYISYGQLNIWTRKGNMGMRLFLLYNSK